MEADHCETEVTHGTSLRDAHIVAICISISNCTPEVLWTRAIWQRFRFARWSRSNAIEVFCEPRQGEARAETSSAKMAGADT